MRYVPALVAGADELERRLTEIGRTTHVDTVGEDWQVRLRSNNTCAGLSITDLAFSMGHGELYGTLYWKWSESVHQSDAAEYLDVDSEAKAFIPRWSTPVEEARRSLHHAATIYWLCLVELNDNLAIEVGQQLKHFESRLCAWKLDDASGDDPNSSTAATCPGSS